MKLSQKKKKLHETHIIWLNRKDLTNATCNFLQILCSLCQITSEFGEEECNGFNYFTINFSLKCLLIL